jgi:hypothetical protein
MLGEEKQLDGGGIPGEHREIHTLRIDSSTERVGSAGPCLEWSQGCRIPNIGFALGDRNGGCHGKVSARDRNGRSMHSVFRVH